jgi:hypothetical protein
MYHLDGKASIEIFMQILCDRCKRETADEFEASIPSRPEEVDLAALPFVVVAEYMHVPSVGGVYFAMDTYCSKQCAK